MAFVSYYKNGGGEVTKIGSFNTRSKAINACVNYKYGDYDADKKSERKSGLELRGYSVIGYSSSEVYIREEDD